MYRLTWTFPFVLEDSATRLVKQVLHLLSSSMLMRQVQQMLLREEAAALDPSEHCAHLRSAQGQLTWTL